MNSLLPLALLAAFAASITSAALSSSIGSALSSAVAAAASLFAFVLVITRAWAGLRAPQAAFKSAPEAGQPGAPDITHTLAGQPRLVETEGPRPDAGGTEGRLADEIKADHAAGVVDVREGPWLKLAEECVNLLDELDRYKPEFKGEQLEIAEHVISRIQEILERSGVEVIIDETSFDRNRHQADLPRADIQRGAPITETLSPGFAVGRRVLRRARVRLA